ncbi:TPA: hypothetical protein ACPY56_004177 [Yersinia enterocolitica]
MVDKETGGPAFPQSGFSGLSGDTYVSKQCGGEGISTRDYFAAKYMQGVSAKSDSLYYQADLAKESYEMADAMLAARSK